VSIRWAICTNLDISYQHKQVNRLCLPIGSNRSKGSLVPTTAGEITGHLNIRPVPEAPARPKGLWEGGVVHRGGTVLGL